MPNGGSENPADRLESLPPQTRLDCQPVLSTSTLETMPVALHGRHPFTHASKQRSELPTMALIGNKYTEKDLRAWLSQHGYFGDTAEFRSLELAALKRPGWLQVFKFEVRAKHRQHGWRELVGVCRDDETTSLFEAYLCEEIAERDNVFTEWSTELIRSDRSVKNPIPLMAAMIVAGLTVIGLAALIVQALPD